MTSATRSRKGHAPALTVAGALVAVLLLAGCAPTKEETPVKLAVTPIIDDLGRFTAEAVGTPVTENPWISHVTIADLDQDGLPDILATDDRLNAIVWLRQVRPGHFEESVLCGDLPGVVHVEAVDFNHTGHQDLLVACMGEVFPNNDRIGSVIILENDGHQHFTKHVLLDHVARVTDVQAANLAGHKDGKLDLAVGQFGYNQGEIRWMKNLGDWKFESHILLSLSGTINVCCADLCGHGYTDIAAVVSQEWEEVVLFKNDGNGNFTNIVLFSSTNEDYGSSGISLCDLNGDGRPDILYTNGDGFGYADPGTRPWHGVQWLENRGDGYFKYHRLGDLAGAYAPVGVSLNHDGVMDVVCVSGFNDWRDKKAASLVVFKNDGRMNFTMHVLAHEPIMQVTCAAGNLDNSGLPSIVTGGFAAYPPFERMGRITVWRQKPKS
ncbi:MAG TPA: VCBS repeat-containing protein [Opitutaceae bacterium]|nr:VCBS repeat-containing protein [Opitutaceae bacterium]